MTYGPTGLIEQRTNDQAPTYPVADATGSLIAEISEQGPPSPLPELDPWGLPAEEQQPPASIADEKTFGFLGAAGREEIPDSGLTKLGARYYDAEVGAFISTDPVTGDPSEPVRRVAYLYAGSNPARFVDADGRSIADGAKWLQGQGNRAYEAVRNPVANAAEGAHDRAMKWALDPNANFAKLTAATILGALSSYATCENIDLNVILLPVGALIGKALAVGGKALFPVIQRALGGKASDQTLRAIERVLRDATEGKASQSIQMHKTGGFARANSDFDAIVGNASVKSHPKSVRSATIPGGTKISVRPHSSGDLPTLEIRTPGAPPIKIRYSN